MDWERIKQLRVTKKLLEGLENLGVTALFLTASNRRKADHRSKFLGYDSAEAMLAAETPFVLKAHQPLCHAILSTPEGQRRCRKDFIKALSSAIESGKPVCHSCHAGLTEMVVPIRSGGQCVGLFRVGEFASGVQDTAGVERLKQTGKSVGAQEDVLRQLPDTTQWFSTDKVAIVQNLVTMMADEIGDYIHQMEKQEGKVAQNPDFDHDGLITNDPHILNILRQLKMVAASDSSIIIYGESGTGKEKIAQLIQKDSNRHDQPLVTINCAALTETLLEAELFGYKKGAFTGATADKEGLFTAADGGTVFLDEVGEMSLGLQVKLLRLIQEGTFMRVGDTKPIQVNVRIISATHQNLRELIAQGKFREDLYYRLAVVELTLPPLRERKGDVVILTQYFLKHYQQKMHKDGIRLSQEAQSMLDGYYWPGNVRELSNEIERVVALLPSHSLVQNADLSKKFFYESAPETVQEVDSEEEGVIKAMVDEFERKLLNRFLRKYQWNKSKVAKLCGITRQGLNKKISKYKLDRRR